MKRLALVVMLVSWSAAAYAAGSHADIDCRPSGDGPVFDCTIRLTDRRTHAPIEGVKFSVTAEMPSMPMAHNIRPVPAAPTTEPGVYRTRLALEMYGTWTVKIAIAGPGHEQIRKTVEFLEAPRTVKHRDIGNGG